jgi:hypothetical protein
MKKHFMFVTLLATTTFAFTSDASATDLVDDRDHEDESAAYRNMSLSDVVRCLSGDPGRDVTEEGTKSLLLGLLAERDELQVSGSVLALKLAQQALDFENALARKEQEHFDAIEALMNEANEKAQLQEEIVVRLQKLVDQGGRVAGNRKFKLGKSGAWMKK